MLEKFMLVISIIVVGLYVLGELIKSQRTARMRNPGIQPLFSGSGAYISSQPATLYHGTSLQTAFEIYNSGMWLVGNSQPPAVWMTDNFAIAKAYARGNGGIVVINAAPWVRLTNRDVGVFIYEIPYARPREEYYQIPGLQPAGVLDVNGNRLV